jgi:hypothetical protein
MQLDPIYISIPSEILDELAETPHSWKSMVLDDGYAASPSSQMTSSLDDPFSPLFADDDDLPSTQQVVAMLLSDGTELDVGYAVSPSPQKTSNLDHSVSPLFTDDDLPSTQQVVEMLLSDGAELTEKQQCIIMEQCMNQEHAEKLTFEFLCENYFQDFDSDIEWDHVLL